MKNKGFGLIQLLVTILIIGIIGITAYKSYFVLGQKNMKDDGKIYENSQPPAVADPGLRGTASKPESVHARKAKELEGRTFISSVVTAERTYEAVNGRFFYTGWTSESKELGVSAMGNRYFKEFSIEKKPGAGFLVKVKGSGEFEGVILSSE